MILYSSPVALTHSRPLDGMHGSISETGTWLELHVLQTACGLLGGKNAWVMRYSNDSCQMVNLLGSYMEIGASLSALLLHAAQNLDQGPVRMMRWNDDTLMCASLSVQSESDGCTYMLCMLFTGQIMLNERSAGIVDGLRCCMHGLISQQLSKQRLEAILAPGLQPVACAGCRRMHTPDHGWMHWDDWRFLTTGRGSSHTICEKCALAIYGEVE